MIKVDEEVKVEITEVLPEAVQEVKTDSKAPDAVKIDGESTGEDGTAVSSKKTVVKSKNKPITPKKKAAALSSQELAASEKTGIQKDVNSDKIIEKPETVTATEPSTKDLPTVETKAVVAKGKGHLKGAKKSAPKAVKEVKEVSKAEEKSTEEREKEPPSKVVIDVEAEPPTPMEIKQETVQVASSDNQEIIMEEEMVGEEDDDEEGDDYEEGDEEGDEDEEEGHEADVLESRPVSERQKRKKLEVFVGGLDKDATEDDLKSVFQQVGDVVEVRLVMNPQTGKNKGYAFVRFGTAEQAKRAATELTRTKVRGKECGVLPNQDNDTLFIGNISRDWKSAEVLQKLKEYHIDGIEEMNLMEDPQNKGLNRGYAFLELATHSDAVKAFLRLQQSDVFFGSDRPAKIDWAQPLNEPDDVVMSQVKSVYVDGMPANWTDDKVKQHFGKFGEIERIVFARNMPSAKRKDFAFINFVARESALACAEAFKEVDLIDGDNKVNVKVVLARPSPKARFGKGSARGEGWSYGPSFGFRKSARGGRGFARASGRGITGRGGKRLYDEEDVHMLLRVLMEEENWSVNPRGRRPSGTGFPRTSRGFMKGANYRGGDNRPYDARRAEPRQDESRRNDVGFARGGYFRSASDRGASRGRSSWPGPVRGKYVPRGSRRGGPSGRGRVTHFGSHISPWHEDVPPQRYEWGHIHGSEDINFGSRAQEYDDTGVGIKRPFSVWDEDPSYYDPGHRGYPRARVDFTEPAPLPDNGTQYLGSVRSPRGRPTQGLELRSGRTGLSSVEGGLGNPGSSSVYGNQNYGSMLPEATDYISGVPEMRGLSSHPSSLYGGHSGSGGYGIQGSGYY